MNVTAQLIAWNATQAPLVSHNSVYTIAPLGSKQFLSFDLKDTLAEAGVSTADMAKYFMHLTVSPCFLLLFLAAPHDAVTLSGTSMQACIAAQEALDV